MTEKIRKKLLTPNKLFEWHEMNYIERKLFVNEVVDRLRELMKKHIGKKKSINYDELFESIYLAETDSFNEYELRFWRDLLNRIIHKLRNREELFIINEGGKHIYVLQSDKELKIFDGIMDSYIEGCKIMKLKANSWVKNKRWKTI